MNKPGPFVLMFLLLISSSFLTGMWVSNDQEKPSYYGNWAIVRNNQPELWYREMYIDEEFMYTYSYHDSTLLLPVKYVQKAPGGTVAIFDYSGKDTIGSMKLLLTHKDTLRLEALKAYAIYVRVKDDLNLQRYLEDTTLQESEYLKAMKVRMDSLIN